MKKYQLLLLLFISISCESCFEIIEQLQLKNDGSGNLQVTLNLSKSKTRLSSILKMETVNGHPVPTKESIVNTIKGIGSTMEKTPGISNVKTTADMENFIAVFSCNFSNITQLNKAIKNVKLTEKAKAGELSDHYNWDDKTKTFQRINKLPLKQTYTRMSKADKEIFSSATYTSIYKFEHPVTASTNKGAKISPSKMAIMLNSNALDIITEKTSIENNIKLTQ